MAIITVIRYYNQQSTVTQVNMSEQNESKCSKILSKLDIFSYIPVPHTYPISSSKSKIGSVIFICIILGYFIYDFVKFVTDNNPVINLYYQNTPNNVKYDMPNIAFGFIYGPNLNMTLNDPSYMTFQFDTISADYVNGTPTTSKTSQTLINQCNPDWLGEYNIIYPNMTCVQNQLQLMNPPFKRLTSLSQRIVVTLCTPNPNSNVTCKNSSEIAQVLAGGRFIMIVNEPQGFDFNTGEVSWSSNPYQVYQFFLLPGLYNRVTIQMYPYRYTTYPTFLTTFTQSQFFYFKSQQPVSLISNVSIYNQYIVASVTMSIAAELTQVEVHYQTLIEHVSMWGALASLIFTIMALCCLAYNKNKFLKKNPSWKQFDKAMKKKIQLEVQNTITRQNDEQASGISSIRKQVELINDI